MPVKLLLPRGHGLLDLPIGFLSPTIHFLNHKIHFLLRFWKWHRAGRLLQIRRSREWLWLVPNLNHTHHLGGHVSAVAVNDGLRHTRQPLVNRWIAGCVRRNA